MAGSHRSLNLEFTVVAGDHGIMQRQPDARISGTLHRQIAGTTALSRENTKNTRCSMFQWRNVHNMLIFSNRAYFVNRRIPDRILLSCHVGRIQSEI